MAIITGLAFIYIILSVTVFIIHSALAMGMTVYTFKPGIISQINMTIRAIIPFTFMLATVYWKIIIMIPGCSVPFFC